LWIGLAICLCLAFIPAAEGAECTRLPLELDQAFSKGDFIAAVEAGEKLFARCPLAAEDLDRLSSEFAAALSEAGRNDRALAVVEQCVARQARSPHCLQQKGAILGKMGRPAAARQAYQAALRYGARPPAAAAGARDDRTEATGHAKSGSGFFINGKGTIITNAHVVADCRRVETAGKAPLKILAVNATIDIAVLQADYAPPAVAVLRAVPPPRVGEDVLAFGYPLPGLLSTEGNVTVGILSADRGMGDDPHLFQITAPVQSGNSGGPLVDGAGNVVGVIVSKLDANKVAQRLGDLPQNVNFAIKAAEVVSILDKLNISYKQGQLGERQSSADLAEATKKFSVQILCFGG